MTRAVPFWDRVETSDGCWRWLGSFGRDGYARVWHGGSMRYAHRIAYELAHGPIPAGLELDHLCRNRGCVNPTHLEPVTHAENMRRSPLVVNRPDVCRRGHPLDYVGPDGRRGCRTCRYAGVVRWRGRLEVDRLQTDPLQLTETA